MKMHLPLVFICIFLSAPAYAGVFGPSDEQDCRETYLPQAKTEVTAKYYNMACRRLFAEKPEISEMIYDLDTKSELPKIDDEDVLLEVLYQKFYSKMPREEYYKSINKKYDEKIDEWQRKKKWAKCILKNSKLKNTQTEIASKSLVGSSDKGICSN